ncbi:SAM-dependent methyltransferase [Paenibacillus albiflavus]|uniref:SAM-dependent methyltransferase n=1 Tax=Paenibacillus albiflavus TaxID=2545760 RepID=A0A4R4ELD5_9BACL|nr:class I SAM-dependent methyltransferase [Paenibacillus albiflavus]TCZ81064.1 SAM-dependent methyltransferase [Paenibacillus albiflavus]
MIVTTSYKPTEEILAQAKEYANELNWKLVPRNHASMNALRKQYNVDRILLVTRDELRCFVGEEPPIFFHPSMAHVRVQRLIRGEGDVMLQAANVTKDDIVLDCTAGLASDSIVFSYAVGEAGRVIALDSEPELCLLLRVGLDMYSSDVAILNEAMRRIEVTCADHYTYLQQAQDKSVDVVYFDPMFRTPLTASNSISPLRGIANPNALTLETIAEARRVARKRVVLKEARFSEEFERLGFQMVVPSGTKLAYGVIQC